MRNKQYSNEQYDLVAQAAWNALRDMAALARQDPSRNMEGGFEYSCADKGSPHRTDYEATARKRLLAAVPASRLGEFIDSDIQAASGMCLAETFMGAVNAGLVVIGTKGDWELRTRTFWFTRRGLRALADGELHLGARGSVARALQEARDAGTLDATDEEIVLLSEAQDCWLQGCFRAATVMIGLANETRCLALIEALGGALRAPTDPKLASLFGSARSTKVSFANRWRPTMELIRAVRAVFQLQRPKASWWHETWTTLPAGLETLGNAVIFSRNAAAHDAAQVFAPSEVAVLLAAMPHQIKLIQGLTEFVRTHPTILPQL